MRRWSTLSPHRFALNFTMSAGITFTVHVGGSSQQSLSRLLCKIQRILGRCFFFADFFLAGAFDRGRIEGARRMGHSISKIVRKLRIPRSTMSRVYQEYMDGGQKTSDRANYKRQLALTVRRERWFKHIVRSQRS
ncbi:HTH_Tnp_Tc3_2 domain-containing protein [Trichonephila clavipes]|nr:HTH_Tnp_Tc3_2 domain-containing protein [Trichonephila clavipes]